MSELLGKTVLLTGASGGLGRSMALALARQGCSLALAGHSGGERLAALAAEVETIGVPVATFRADLNDAAGREALARDVQARFGVVDILINNAAVEAWGSFARLPESEIARIIQTNLTATLLVTRLLLPEMCARGSGHLVNIASMAGKAPAAYNATYSATKAALIAWSDALRAELEDCGVRVSVVCPTFVSEAGMFAQHGARAPRAAREVTPEQVAQAVVKVLRSGAGEALVVNLPARPLLAIRALFPGFYDTFFRATGLRAFLRSLGEKAEARRAAQERSGGDV